jgi:hypothetical protein
MLTGIIAKYREMSLRRVWLDLNDIGKAFCVDLNSLLK